MDPTTSISKGVFVFKNKSKPIKHLTKQLCYQNYKKTWNWLEKCIKEVLNENYEKVIGEIVHYIENCCCENILPTAAVLTGINQPDHVQRFEFLSQNIIETYLSKVVIMKSNKCTSLKNMIETMVYEFITENSIDEDCQDEKQKNNSKFKKSQCTMETLKCWYENEYPNEECTLVVILSDFECFTTKILEDFILILSSYYYYLPIVLILGVATSVTSLHSMLSYNVTSKIRLKIFHCESATNTLNQILEKVVLSPKCSFHLSGRVIQFLCDIFLFYDFSIHGFINGLKYCVMEHYLQSGSIAFSLCTDYDESLKIIPKLTHEDLKIIRELPSFRRYIESKENSQKIPDDISLKKNLPEFLKTCHIFFMLQRYFYEFFMILIENLPNNPLGKSKREIYTNCTVKLNLIDSTEFKECWKLLGFLSKNEFLTKFEKAITDTINYVQNNTETHNEISETCAQIVNLKLNNIKCLLKNVRDAGTKNIVINASSSATSTDFLKKFTPESGKKMKRHEFREELLKLSKQEKPISEFLKSIHTTLDYIKTEIIQKHLISLQQSSSTICYELFVFSDIASIRRNIVGSPRSAFHMALNDPHFYLQCDCCELKAENSSCLLNTMPDISIAYKLHLESGRMINLFDWLQAFRSIVDDNENDQIDQSIQARFTRAIAELQYLGYIKTSKRKTDHVQRLTW